MTRKFIIDYSVYSEDSIAQAIIELDDKVIDVVDDDWRKHLYNLNTPEEIALHVAYNLIENRIGLSLMDGWADMDNSMAKVLEWPDIPLTAHAREIK